MKKVIFLFLILFSSNVFSQENNNIINVFSFYNNDNIFFKFSIIKDDSNRTIIIEIKNNSKKRIYIDTSYIIPFVWSDSIKGPVIGVGLSHINNENVNEYNLSVNVINPSKEISLIRHITRDIFVANFNNVKYYSFNIKYLNEENLNKAQIGKERFKMPIYTYYTLSERYVIGNCDMENYISD